MLKPFGRPLWSKTPFFCHKTPRPAGCRRFSSMALNRRKTTLLRIAGASIASGVAVYLTLKFKPFQPSKLPLPMIDEDNFDSADDFIVLIIKSHDADSFPYDVVAKLRPIVPKDIALYYTVRQGDSNTNLKMMFYKGLRKKYYDQVKVSNDDEIAKLQGEIQVFFQPQSQDAMTLQNDDSLPEYVTLDNFEQRVINDASRKSPIVLQLYEENCFLCFLMRPFINSINLHLKEIGHPIRIKRLNIEANDFPKGCPVTRATPTFVYYDGGKQGRKWKEFKPQDFITKLAKEGKLSKSSLEYMEKLSNDISRRFMLFGELARWLAESQLIQELVLTGEASTSPEDDMYSRAIKILMDIDMTRTDSLEENLQHLKKEVDSSEQDCIAMAQVLAQEVIKDEERLDQNSKI